MLPTTWLLQGMPVVLLFVCPLPRSLRAVSLRRTPSRSDPTLAHWLAVSLLDPQRHASTIAQLWEPYTSTHGYVHVAHALDVWEVQPGQTEVQPA